jgi:hypothetical protein
MTTSISSYVELTSVARTREALALLWMDLCCDTDDIEAMLEAAFDFYCEYDILYKHH